MASEFNVANLEFDSIKSNLLAYMQGQEVFRDYNFTGSNLNVLLDVLAYNTYYNNIYLNHVATEMFLDSAQLRDSVYSLAKSLNYLPRSYRSSVAYINIDVNPDDNPHSITIPRLTQFTTVVDETSYVFSTNNDIVVYANNGYLASNVAIYEGTIVNEAYLVSNNNNTYYINNFDVDITSLTIKVRNSTSDDTNTIFLRANSLFNVTSTSNVFFVEPSSNGSYNVVFGNGTFGRSLSNNNVVEMTYRVSNGLAPNGANNFSAASVAGYDAAVSLVTRATNGAEFESLDDIRFQAPRALAVQERAVTKLDYETLITREFNDITDTHVFGGEELNPPEFGTVVITARSDSFDIMPLSLKNQITSFIKPKTPIGVSLQVYDPFYTDIEITSTVKFNRNLTTDTSSEISSVVVTAIETFNTANLNKFNKTFRRSKLSESINSSHSSILGNDTKVRMVKTVSPNTNVSFTSSLLFHNELNRTNPINPDTQDAYVRFSNPTVTSEVFSYNNITGASLRDDGKGTLQVVTANTTDLNVLNSNVGTVNYTTGEVSIANLVISSYASTNTSFKVYATPKDTDIEGKFRDIVRIRNENIKLTIVEERN